MMLEGKGLEVFDLGTDVPAERFVSAAIEHDAQLICCSALLTTTMGEMKNVVDAAVAAGIRDKVTIPWSAARRSMRLLPKASGRIFIPLTRRRPPKPRPRL